MTNLKKKKILLHPSNYLFLVVMTITTIEQKPLQVHYKGLHKKIIIHTINATIKLWSIAYKFYLTICALWDLTTLHATFASKSLPH